MAVPPTRSSQANKSACLRISEKRCCIARMLIGWSTLRRSIAPAIQGGASPSYGLLAGRGPTTGGRLRGVDFGEDFPRRGRQIVRGCGLHGPSAPAFLGLSLVASIEDQSSPGGRTR